MSPTVSIVKPNLYTQKTPASQDWPSHYLLYRLREAGTSYARISRLHRYHVHAAEIAKRQPWPKMERHIADAIGVTPQEIWPSRYRADGTPIIGKRGGFYLRKNKNNTVSAPGNVQGKRPA